MAELEKEEQLFNRTITAGLKEMDKVLNRVQNNLIDGQTAFHLYDTYGFPLEFTQEIATEHNVQVDVEGFNKCYEAHQELSRKGAEQKFKGGLADHSEKSAHYHTATHIMHAMLRQMFGDTVAQKGSNITPERMRFDFSFDRKMTPEEVAELQAKVNAVIEQKIPVVCEEKTLEEAQAEGAIGLFAHKYDAEKVKVYTIGTVSKEVCGGPHAQNTGDLGHFRILKEESSSAGVRRIKAVLE
jgi:alanyl-tRNA synthetase